jgi:hypothetical protein
MSWKKHLWEFRQKSCVDEPQYGFDVVPNQGGKADLQLQLSEVVILPPVKINVVIKVLLRMIQW